MLDLQGYNSKTFISDTDLLIENRPALFILTRPWFDSENHVWKVAQISSMNESELILIPFSINFYFQRKIQERLNLINQNCKKLNIKAYAYISGDFGISYPEYSNIIYFRPSGFKSQLSPRNIGIPVAVSDHFQSIYKKDSPIPRNKSEKPIIGFCGHASFTWEKKWKEKIKFLVENLRRFFLNPFRRDWEPLFASAFERAKSLKSLAQNDKIKTNFIFRNNYRAGEKNTFEREKTTLDYFNNILESDYILCMRGGGNFSVRFYETLMMGKIPVFINTDCLLPFPNVIDWKKHVVWVEWKERERIGEILINFHQKLSNDEFIQLQLENRKLWKETLSIRGMLKMIQNDI